MVCFLPYSQTAKSVHRRTDDWMCRAQASVSELTRKQGAFHSCTGYSSVLLRKSHLQRYSRPLNPHEGLCGAWQHGGLVTGLQEIFVFSECSEIMEKSAATVL